MQLQINTPKTKMGNGRGHTLTLATLRKVKINLGWYHDGNSFVGVVILFVVMVACSSVSFLHYTLLAKVSQVIQGFTIYHPSSHSGDDHDDESSNRSGFLREGILMRDDECRR